MYRAGDPEPPTQTISWVMASAHHPGNPLSPADTYVPPFDPPPGGFGPPRYYFATLALGLLEKTSIAVVCSRWNEPFGRTSLEAASRGCAVIISNRGGLPETTDYSLIINKLNSDELFKNIKRLIENVKLRKKLMLLLLVLSVASCGSIGSGNKGYCIISSPINPTDADIDVISDELVDDLLIHNEIYERLCE